jgi:hypothetical protein
MSRAPKPRRTLAAGLRLPLVYPGNVSSADAPRPGLTSMTSTIEPLADPLAPERPIGLRAGLDDLTRDLLDVEAIGEDEIALVHPVDRSLPSIS